MKNIFEETMVTENWQEIEKAGVNKKPNRNRLIRVIR